MRLLTALERRPATVAALAAALLLLGAWAARYTPLEWEATAALPEVRVGAAWPGASPQQVERFVLAPLENALAALPGTAGTASRAQSGGGTLTLRLAPAADGALYLAAVRDEAARLRDALPPGVRVTAERARTGGGEGPVPLVTFRLTGERPLAELRRLAEQTVRPELERAGAGQVAVEGGEEVELRVTVRPEALAAAGLTPADVAAALAAAAAEQALGTVREAALAEARLDATPAAGAGTGGEAALAAAAPRSLEAWRRVPVVPASGGAVRALGAVADVALRPTPAPVVVRVDGAPAVTLTAHLEPGRHLLAAAADLRAAATRAGDALPSGVRLLTEDDASAPVRAALLDVGVRWLAGLALVFALLAAMLGSLRAVGLVALALAASLALALLALRALGLPLNVMTLAALTLLSGLVVDAAVVVVEAVLRRARTHARGLAAGAAAEVARPLAGGALTTAVLVVPLLFLSGELRAVLLPVGIVVGVTLLAALGLAFGLVAPLAPRLPRGRVGAGGRLPGQPAFDVLAHLAVRFPRATLAAVALGIGVPLWWLPPRVSPGPDPQAPRALLARAYNETLGTPGARALIRDAIPYVGGAARLFRRDVTFASDRLPPDLPEVRVSLRLPPGADPARADSLLRRFEATALADPDVRSVQARLSGREARLRVRYTDAAVASGRALASRERLVFEAVQSGGLDIAVVGLDPLGYSASSGGYVSPMWVEARGPDYDRLDTLAHAFARFVRARSPLVGYTSATGSSQGMAPEPALRLLWGDDVTARTGLRAADAAAAFAASTAGGYAAGTAYLPEAGLLPVRVMLPEAPLADAPLPDVRALAAQPFALPGARPARLGLAGLALEPGPQAIDREDRQYRRYVLVEFRGPGTQAEPFLDEALAAFPVPPGYSLAPRERSRFWETARRPLGLALGGAAVFVFLVMAATFESWRLPALCAAFLPSAALGAMAALARGGAVFNEGAAVGCVLLVGVAVNDGILLVDRYARLRRARPSADARRLVRAAVRARTYPMWTTTLSTILGLVPLIVLPASTFWHAFALAVLGGLLASTLLGPACVAAAVGWAHARAATELESASGQPS